MHEDRGVTSTTAALVYHALVELLYSSGVGPKPTATTGRGLNLRKRQVQPPTRGYDPYPLRGKNKSRH